MQYNTIEIINNTFKLHNIFSLITSLSFFLITLDINFLQFILCTIYITLYFFDLKNMILCTIYITSYFFDIKKIKISLTKYETRIVDIVQNLLFYLLFNILIDDLNKKHKFLYEIFMRYLNFCVLFVIAYFQININKI